jgi:exonuclease V gamma subunit
MAAWNISAEDIEIWGEWTKKLNVYHSFDQEHKEEQGYAATPMFTWRQALQRLRLSKVMLVQEQDGVISDWQGLIPYEDMHSQSGSFDRFLNLIEQLELLHKRSHKATEIRQWGEIIESMLTQFYAIPAEYKEEAFVKQCVLKSVQRWPALDPYEFNTQVSLALVTSMLEDALSAIPSCYGTFLSGISIASIRKIQSIPFRHIYILGMQEGQFPGKSKDSILDLRQALEDFQPVDEVSLNRYAFLECLLSAKEKLVVTYQGRDLHSGEEFFPNSVLSQLLRSIKDVTKGSFNIQDIPLRCDQPDYTLTEVYAKHDKLLSLYKATGNLDLQKECSPEYFFPQLPEDKVKNVKVGDLKNFLKDPHVAVASYQLGLYGADNADETLRSIEPLVVEFPFSVQLPKLAAKYLLDNPELNEAQFKEYFEQLYHNAQLKGNVPEDVFGEIDFEEQLQLFINGGQLPHWHESFHKEHPLESSCHLSLSSTMQPDEPYHFYLPPLKLNDEEVHLSGSLADCRDLPEALTCLVLTTSKGADFSHHMIKPMLFYICALCSDEGRLWLNGRPLRIYKLYKSDILDMAVFEFSVTQEQAEDYLQSLVEDFLGTKSFDLLPFRHFKKTKPYPFVEDNERVDDYPERIASKIAADQKFKLNELEQLLDPQIPEDAWDLVKKRFSLLCQQLTEVKL